MVDDATRTTPRWVKIFWLAVAAGVLVFAVLHLAGRGFGRHFDHGQPPSSGTP